jgi:phage tail sheath protein FI
MANFTVSPGVTTNELDQTFLTGQPVQAGAAIIGPTVKGPFEVPTLVTSYSQYTSLFGDSFISGGINYSYLTSIAAYNYFNYGGSSLLVARVANGSYTPATSNIPNTVSSTNGTFATASIEISSSYTASSAGAIGGGVLKISVPSIGSTYTDYWLQSADWTGTNSYYDAAFNVGYISMSSQPTLNEFGTLIADFINSTTNQQFNPTTTPTEINQLFSASFETSTKVLSIFPKQSSSLYNGTTIRMGAKPGSFVWGGAPDENFVSSSIMANGVDGVSSTAFTLETISQGIIMNNSGSETLGALVSGSKDNVRVEITNTNTGSGIFNVLVRQGNDTTNNKNILESFNEVNLDPNSDRFISLVIGDQKLAYNSTNNQMELSGSYPNISRYVRVKSVNYPTPTYLNSNGTISNASYTSSLPTNGSGSFSGATGTVAANVGSSMYDLIGTTTQGLTGSDYTNMVNLFGNKEAYQFNLLFTPGLLNDKHTSVVSTIISNTQNRGDNLYVLDLIDYNGTVASIIPQAQTRNTSYAASYWPWVRIVDPATGKQVWVPASTVIPGVYAFNDKVSAPWFAPAGINRGGLSTVLQAQFKLTQANKDSLYSNNINPLATLPKNGVVVFGQKTLQKQSSALDRVNVRRLMIEMKNYIRQIADTVVFEQNTIATRNSFVARVTPFLEGIQQKQGLYAYKIIMDESNNGPAVIDQNQLVGQIYIQPTRTAEFISLDFILLPTGAEFPG